MTARLLDVDAPEWASFLLGTRYDFYHLPAYVALCAAYEHGDPTALYVEDAGRAMLLPLIIRDIPGTDRRDATSPYGYPGPLVCGTDDPAFVSEALVAGVAALRAEGIVSLFVRLHPLLNTAPPEGIGEVVLHGDTVSIDLRLPEAMLSAQMRHNHRRDIRKAERSGLVARIDREFERYDDFRRLYRATMDRLAADTYYYFHDEHFDALRDALGNRLLLCVVEADDLVVAAGLFVETDGIVQYHLGGTDPAHIKAEPSKLMVQFACRWAKARGNRCLHLGGGVGGTNDSLLYFKRGFSPLLHPFRTLRVVIDKDAYERLVRTHAPTLEPTTPGGYFPLYRAGLARDQS